MVMADGNPRSCSLCTAIQDDKKTFGVVRRELLERSSKIDGFDDVGRDCFTFWSFDVSMSYKSEQWLLV